MRIAGRGALVAGGASGLGEATVRRLHADGARVVVADLNEDRGRALAEELRAGVSFVRADVSDPDAVGEAVAAAAALPGGLRISVCCAGIGWAEKVAGKRGAHTLQPFETVILVNLIGTFNVLRLSAAAMSQNEPDDGGERGAVVMTASIAAFDGQIGQTAYSASKGGVVALTLPAARLDSSERGVCVNTASIAAFDGQIGQIAYSASKGGIVGMTLPAARDLAGGGVRVCTVAPGTFDTPLLGALPEEAREALAGAIPFPSRLGRPDEYAALVTHIVENEMLNGEVIRLDGALRMPPR